MLLVRAAAPLLVWTRPPTTAAFAPRVFAPSLCAAASTGVNSLAPQLSTWLDKALAAEERKRGALAKEADAAKNAEKLGHWATLVVSNLYRIDSTTERVTVEDWDNGGQPTELVFNPADGTPKEQADKERSTYSSRSNRQAADRRRRDVR